jgi:hypothetical protein
MSPKPRRSATSSFCPPCLVVRSAGARGGAVRLNFLTGGTSNDTFYIDDRNPTSPVFSTIANFHASDNATVWRRSISQMMVR